MTGSFTSAQRVGRRRLSQFVVAAMGFAASCALAQGTPPPDGTAPAPAPDAAPTARVAPPNDPAALAVLTEAASAQLGGKPRKPESTPLALHVKVQLQWRSAEGDDVSIEAERRFLAPDLIWTKAVDTYKKSETIRGYDGKRPWLWSKSGGLRFLNEPGLEADRKQLMQDVDITELLTTAFQLDRLVPRLSGLARLPDESGYGLVASVVEGEVEVPRDGGPKIAKLRLWIEQKERHLMGARLVVPDEPTVQISFTRHQRADGLDVPREIKIYEDGKETPSQTLYVSYLSIDPRLTPADFAPPR